MDVSSLLGGMGGSGGGGGDSGMSKATSQASQGNYSTSFGLDSKTLLWIVGGVLGTVLLGFVMLLAFKKD
jgi:hypothetical protein